MTACEDNFEDTIPESFYKIQLNPDEIYIYTGGPSYGTRLDPLLNDSIKVDVTVSYSTPTAGIISFIPNEGWFYKPNDGFIGVDNFDYTVCLNGTCDSAPIKMHVETPLDPNTCTYLVQGETVETLKNQPVEIRIYMNDIVCPSYLGNSISSPEKGTFNVYSYSGTIKNIVYVYFPPKGFVGTDRFKYKVFTPDGDMEAYCTITVKE
jgi:hypothetical protein